MSLRLPVCLLLVVSISAAVFVGCSNGGGSSSLTTAQATAASQTVMDAVNIALFHLSGTTTISYTGGGISLNGTQTSGATSTLNANITLTNFLDAGSGYTASGHVTYNAQYTPPNASGTIVITDLSLSGGPVTSGTINVSFSGSPANSAYIGTATFNGSSFDANSLSMGKGALTYVSQQAVHAGRTVVTNAEPWTNVSGNSYTYTSVSPSGISMNGTLSTVGNIKNYDLNITFSSFADSGSGYTISTGSNHWVQAHNTVSGDDTITSSGSVSLSSNGQVTALSWDAGYTTAGGLTGTITCDGVVCDARILFGL